MTLASELGALDGLATAQAIRDGEVSAQEVAEAAVSRCRSTDRQLNAIAADAYDTFALPDDPAAPFFGVPIVIKDNDAWPGLPTRQGSRATSPAPAAGPSGFAADLAALGFVVVGTSTMPEFGITASTESTLYGATRNPWNPDRTAGGSSGGSAAHVAGGALPMAHAKDGGGSIRIPASCTGLVGLKSSRDRFTPADGTENMPVNVVVQGMLSRTVRDTAHAYHALAQLRGNPQLPPLPLVAGPGSRRLRIGYYTMALGGLEPDQPTRNTLERAAATLAGAGHDVTRIANPYDDQLGKDFLRYWAVLCWALKNGGKAVHGPGFDRSQVGLLVSSMARMAVSQLPKVPGSMRRLQRHSAGHGQPFGDYDVLLSPVLGHEPPPLGYLGPEVEFRDQLIRLLRWANHTALANVSGVPAISLPGGFGRAGVPIGIQLTGPVGSEEMLLELAYEWEALSPWPLSTADHDPAA